MSTTFAFWGCLSWHSGMPWCTYACHSHSTHIYQHGKQAGPHRTAVVHILSTHTHTHITAPQYCDFVQCDFGQGLPLRPQAFHAAISISAVQWLCHHAKATACHAFFSGLNRSLLPHSLAVLQLYMEGGLQAAAGYVLLQVILYRIGFAWSCILLLLS